MNIELLLRQYLYKNKAVTYPFIGKLAFGANTQLPLPDDKAEAFPLQDLQFSFNLHQEIDPDFIAFVSAQTGKIKPLAAADVESYFMLSKQFINIGKSFVVDGIGSVEKLDNGTFAFTPGYYLPISEASAAPHKPLKIRETVPALPKTETKTKKEAAPINKSAVLLIVGVVVLGLIGWAVYHFAFANNNTPTAQTTTPITDTLVTKIDTLVTTPTTATQLIGGFKAVVDQRFTRIAATARAAKLRTFGHNAQVDSVAPTSFIIYVPIKDTTISVDTLQLIKINGKRPKFLPM